MRSIIFRTRNRLQISVLMTGMMISYDIKNCAVAVEVAFSKKVREIREFLSSTIATCL